MQIHQSSSAMFVVYLPRGCVWLQLAAISPYGKPFIYHSLLTAFYVVLPTLLILKGKIDQTAKLRVRPLQICVSPPQPKKFIQAGSVKLLSNHK